MRKGFAFPKCFTLRQWRLFASFDSEADSLDLRFDFRSRKARGFPHGGRQPQIRSRTLLGLHKGEGAKCAFFLMDLWLESLGAGMKKVEVAALLGLGDMGGVEGAEAAFVVT